MTYKNVAVGLVVLVVLVPLVFLGVLTILAGPMALPIAKGALDGNILDICKAYPFVLVPLILGLCVSLWQHRAVPFLYGLVATLAAVYLASVVTFFNHHG